MGKRYLGLLEGLFTSRVPPHSRRGAGVPTGRRAKKVCVCVRVRVCVCCLIFPSFASLLARLLACLLACSSFVVSRLLSCALGVGFLGSALVFVRSLFPCSFCLVACWMGCRYVGRASGVFSVLRSPCSFACWCWPAPLLLACERHGFLNECTHSIGMLLFDQGDKQFTPSIIAPAGLLV